MRHALHVARLPAVVAARIRPGKELPLPPEVEQRLKMLTAAGKDARRVAQDVLSSADRLLRTILDGATIDQLVELREQAPTPQGEACDFRPGCYSASLAYYWDWWGEGMPDRELVRRWTKAEKVIAELEEFMEEPDFSQERDPDKSIDQVKRYDTQAMLKLVRMSKKPVELVRWRRHLIRILNAFARALGGAPIHDPGFSPFRPPRYPLGVRPEPFRG